LEPAAAQECLRVAQGTAGLILKNIRLKLSMWVENFGVRAGQHSNADNSCKDTRRVVLTIDPSSSSETHSENKEKSHPPIISHSISPHLLSTNPEPSDSETNLHKVRIDVPNQKPIHVKCEFAQTENLLTHEVELPSNGGSCHSDKVVDHSYDAKVNQTPTMTDDLFLRQFFSIRSESQAHALSKPKIYCLICKKKLDSVKNEDIHIAGKVHTSELRLSQDFVTLLANQEAFSRPYNFLLQRSQIVMRVNKILNSSKNISKLVCNPSLVDQEVEIILRAESENISTASAAEVPLRKVTDYDLSANRIATKLVGAAAGDAVGCIAPEQARHTVAACSRDVDLQMPTLSENLPVLSSNSLSSNTDIGNNSISSISAPVSISSNSHPDSKLENIFMAEKKESVVGDFGLSSSSIFSLPVVKAAPSDPLTLSKTSITSSNTPGKLDSRGTHELSTISSLPTRDHHPSSFNGIEANKTGYHVLASDGSTLDNVVAGNGDSGRQGFFDRKYLEVVTPYKPRKDPPPLLHKVGDAAGNCFYKQPLI
jgi:hypothetical protein